MKVLYFSKGFNSPIPGPQMVGRILFDHLQLITDEIEFFIITNKKKSYRNDVNQLYYLNNTLTLPEIPVLSFKWENFLAANVLRAACEKLKPNLVHIHGYAGFYPPPPDRYRTLITFHDFPPMMISDNFSVGPLKHLEKLWIKQAQKIRLTRMPKYNFFHALSTEIVEFLQSSGIDASRIFLIPNGTNEKTISFDKRYFQITIRKILNLKPDDKILMMIGTMTYNKGIHIAKKCLETLPSNFHLVLIGKSPKFVGKQYLKSVLTGKCSKRIHFVGYQSPNVINAFLNGSDCFLSLSTSEACQLSPIEAIFTEIPVIITDCGAAKDIFGSDYDLLLPVPPNVRQLREKIIYAIQNKSKHAKILTNHKTWKEVAILLKETYYTIAEKDMD